MKKPLISLLFLLLAALPLSAHATPVSWDAVGASSILQPLQAMWGYLVKADRYQATSTTASSTLPKLDTVSLSISSLLSGCLQVGTGGYVTSTGSSCTAALNFTYPLVNTANTISLAFGTTTPNTWSAYNNFTYGINAALASSTNATTTGSLYLTGLMGSTGGLAIDANNKVYKGATTTAGTGLTYSGNAFNVNTSQNISTLSNLTSNGFVITSGGTGALSIDTTTYTPTTRTITLAGTANQVTSSAGAQDLSANRTWTLGLATHVIQPSMALTSGSTTNATTTGSQYFSFLTGSTQCLQVDTNGKVGGTGSACGSGGGAADFTWANTYGAINAATSSNVWIQGALNASTTIRLKTNILTSNAIGFFDVQRDAQTAGNGYTLARIKAPTGASEEATLALLIDFDQNNAGVNERFVDFYSERYSDSNQAGIRIFQTGSATLPNAFVFGWKLEAGSKDSQNVAAFYPNGGWLFGGPATTTQTANTLVTISSTTATNLLDVKAGINASRLMVLGTGSVGIGSTSPYAKLSVHANNEQTQTTLFAIGSSTAAATTTLFSISNIGTINIATTTSGCVQSTATGLLWIGSCSGSGGTPGGSATELQYRSGASTFGAVSSAYHSARSSLAIGTTTFTTKPGVLTLGTSTPKTGSPLLSLSGGAGVAGWGLFNQGGIFTLATTSDRTGATTTLQSVFTATANGAIGIASNTPQSMISIGALGGVLTHGLGFSDGTYKDSNGIMIVKDEKTVNTAGGSSVAGTQVRTLNTVTVNTIVGASLASNQVTLPAGTYSVRACAPAFISDKHKLIWFNVTDTATTTQGSTAYNDSTTNVVQTDACLDGYFTITASKTYELRHWIQVARATNGLGVFMGQSTEVYSRVIIEKR